MEIIYKANDGTQFNNEKECFNYERAMESRYDLSNVVLIDHWGNILKARNRAECYRAIEHAFYIVLKTEEDYKKIETINKEGGFTTKLPKYNKNCEGQETIFAYKYADTYGLWVNLNECLAETRAEIERIKTLVAHPTEKKVKKTIDRQ